MAEAEVTLKEFMNLRFNGLDEKVGDLNAKVDDQGKRIKALEDCISNDVKHAIKMWRYVGGVVVAIVIALSVAGLKAWLGW